MLIPHHLPSNPASTLRLNLINRINPIRKIIALVISVLVIVFFVPQPIFRQRLITGVSRHGFVDRADVSYGGVGSGAVEPDALNACHVVLSKLVCLGAVDDLLHVGIVHGEDHVAALGGFGGRRHFAETWC
jgi:hypothetical protein